MGYNYRELRVTARTSAHNDERDVADEAAWDEFIRRVGELAADPGFSGISLLVHE